MRKIVVAGNWKMNKTPAETTTLINELKPLVKDSASDVIVCVPFTNLYAAVEACKGSNIKVGAQNMYFEESGAFTGEIAPSMLTELGVEYVIIEHSERRQYFAETDETVNKKVIKAFEHKLIPIICVGESLEEREQGVTFEIVAKQTKVALGSLTADQVKSLIIAYEPIWAIGTGKTATSDQAQEVCAVIRKTVAEVFGKDAADAVTIQYGGSVKASNAAELFAKKDIDGGLIGGASLKAEDFNGIVNY